MRPVVVPPASEDELVARCDARDGQIEAELLRQEERIIPVHVHSIDKKELRSMLGTIQRGLRGIPC